MRCEEVMSTNVECVSPHDSVEYAAQKMRDSNVGFLPVCDTLRKVIGTITDRDLAIRILAEGRSTTTSVRQAMSQTVISCRPDEDLKNAEGLMAEHQKSRIVCVDHQGRLAGVISLADISQYEEAAEVSRMLRQVKAA
jgi:CBS domain-containing protein